MKRILSIVFSCVLLLSLLSAFSLATFAAEEKEIVIVAGSDFQPKDNVANGQKRLRGLLDSLKAQGVDHADDLFFLGDYSVLYDKTQCEAGLQAVKNVMGEFVDRDMYFLQGNHDEAATAGLSPFGNNDTEDYGLYMVSEDDYAEWGSYNKAGLNALKDYLDEKVAVQYDKPIFILCHIPLHWGNRTMKDGSGSNGYKFYKVINDAAATGLNIIYMFGHNHSSGYDDFMGAGAIYLKKGDKMMTADGTYHDFREVTLNFTYMNAGYTAYYSTNDSRADATLTLSVLRVKGNEVVITRYDSEGVHNLKSAGIDNPDFSATAYRAEPNTTVYPSSRKVTATDDIQVDPPKPVTLESVTLESLPTKSVYLVGEKLDLTGMELKLHYSDGSEESITEGFKSRGFQSITTGKRKCYITYEGYEYAFEYEVVEEINDDPVDPPVDPDDPVDPPVEKKNGWIQEEGKWAYYENDVKLVNQWKKDSVGWCYLSADGYMATNKWIKDSVGWCYVGANGYCVTNKWVADSKGWCYLDDQGRMATNKWIKDSVGWCYVGDNGYCVTNKWVADSKGWCYLDGSGRMVTNKWVKDSVGWCYVGANGYCLTNAWVKDSVGWCYLDASGRMVYSNWVTDGGKQYYINANGYMVTGKQTIDGKVYTFNNGGALIA